MLFTLLTMVALADDASPFTCCDDAVVERIVVGWLDVSEQLAEGRSHSDGMRALAKLADTKVDADDRAAVEQVKDEAGRLSAMSGSEARAAVGPLARQVLWLALRHESGAVRVVQATCPGVGSWIQRDRKNVVNPFGRSCGSLR